MKIVQFSDSFLPIVDGVGNVSYQYAYNFGLKGNESYVVAPLTDTGYRGNLGFEIIDYVGISSGRLKAYTFGIPSLDSNCRARLSMIKGDIVHVHDPFTAGNAGILYAKKNKIPIIGTFHSKYYDDFLDTTGLEIAAVIGTKSVVDFYKKCDEVWTVSKSAADVLHSYGYKKSIKVIPNGTNIVPLDPVKYEAMTKKYRADEASVLLYVGQLNWKKNIKTILEAFSLLSINCKLVLAGQGPDEHDIRRTAKKLGIEDRIHFTGHIKDRPTLDALYAASDLFVFPSLYDTSGLVIREAAAMGTPSIAVRGSAAGEDITDLLNGFLCENKPADLAKSIERALSDRDRLSLIGERAKQTLPIPWSQITDTILSEYERVIADKRKRALERAKARSAGKSNTKK